MKPKKSLGQNFLTSIPARMAIAKAGLIENGETVLEIGPGKGFLTEELLGSGAHVIAVEKDRDLLPILQASFGGIKNFRVEEGDVLTYEPPKEAYKLIANIPYYITGAIFERFLTHQHQPKTMVVLIQKEVAERIVAQDKKESILSLSVKAYGSPKIVYRVSRGSFNPAPTVDSAVLAVYEISRKNFLHAYHEEMFFKVVKAGFSHKRKMLISNLKEHFPHISFLPLFVKLSISEKIRAEDVTLSSWISLSRELL